MTPHLSEPLWRMGAEPAVGAEPAGAQQVPPPPPPAGPPPVRRLLLERSPRAPREFPPTGAEPDAEPVAANTQDAGEPAIEGAEEPMAEAEEPAAPVAPVAAGDEAAGDEAEEPAAAGDEAEEPVAPVAPAAAGDEAGGVNPWEGLE